MPPRTGPRTKLTKELAFLLEGARLAAGINYHQVADLTNDWIRLHKWQMDPVDSEDVARLCRHQVKSSSILLAVMGALGVDEKRAIAVFEPLVADVARRMLAIRKADLGRFAAVEARFREVLDVVDAELAAKKRADDLVGNSPEAPLPPGSDRSSTKRQ